MRVIKKYALILNIGLALVTASTIHAQESNHLSADYLKQATPLIHWPKGLEPRNADVFVHNEGWKTFGFPIRSTVDVFEPDREIGWSVYNSAFKVHHAWILVPERGGTRVITEEAQKGADAIRFRLDQPNAMYDGHDWWISALKVRSERMAQH